MKRLLLIVLLSTACNFLFAQTIDWHLGGNNEIQLLNQGNQRIGTITNYPFRFITNDLQRMHINESGTTFGSTSAPTGGFIGIGLDPTDVRSRLTITGGNNTAGFTGNGYRDWMVTGVFNLENSDNMYVGMKEEDINRSDALIAFTYHTLLLKTFGLSGGG